MCVCVHISLHVCAIVDHCVCSEAYETEATAVTQRETVSHWDSAGLHQKTTTALSSLQIQPLRHGWPCIPNSTSCMQNTSATQCFEACGKQVLICYLCEKLRLNEGFTSHDQRWWGTRWLRILAAFGYHYVMADPFLLAACFRNQRYLISCKLHSFVRAKTEWGERKHNKESQNNGYAIRETINWKLVIFV